MESTKDTRLIREITLQNILSFGPDTAPLPLHNLNVLIGPNGSGKSNLFECINLLRHSTTDMRPFIQAGGVNEWAWKGGIAHTSLIRAKVTVPQLQDSISHALWFDAEDVTFRFKNEVIERMGPDGTTLVLDTQSCEHTPGVDTSQSFMSQCDAVSDHPEISYLADLYDRVAIYREWYFGRYAILRKPQSVEMRNDRLEEDFSNLGLVLQRLQAHPEAKQTILENLKDLYDGVTDYEVHVNEGNVQVCFTEGDFTIPAMRLSSGTLRYLCLLAILCDPNPPALICIDEPELSLHPDVLPKIADLLMDAATRTQLIITTHSDILVDAMSEQPECVVVCDKFDGRTVMKRLSHAALAHWLEEYRLGELWTRGELGGTRW